MTSTLALETNAQYLQIFPLDSIGKADTSRSFMVWPENNWAEFVIDQKIYPAPWFGILATDQLDDISLPGHYTVPGTIEAEDFDNNAYHDNTENNSGKQYRPSEAVDIRPCGSDCYAVGWTGVGEWMDYTVNAQRGGIYELSVKYTSPSGGGSVVFSTKNQTSDTMRMENTSDWSEWKYASTSIPLEKGIQQIRLQIINGGFDFDHIRFEPQTSSQTMALQEGWNLISLYVEPQEDDVLKIFPNAQQIKSSSDNWQREYPMHLNSLKAIRAKKGYLLLNTRTETIVINGLLQKYSQQTQWKPGWHLIPASSDILTIPDFFGNNLPRVQSIKSTNQFWLPDGSGQLQFIEPGKAYFIFISE